MKPLKLFLNQVKAHPVAVLFLIVSYMTSSILISIWTSNSVQLRNFALEKTEGLANNTLEVTASFGRDVNFDELISILTSISKESNITLQKVFAKVDNISIPLSFEYFSVKPNWRYPLLNGIDFTTEDMVMGNHEALIGKSLEHLSYYEDGEKKIRILDEEYNVKGIIGRYKQATPWDDQVFIPLKATPKLSRMRFSGQQAFTFLIKNNNSQPIEDTKMLEKRIKSEGSIFTVRELDSKNDILASSFSKNSNLTRITVTIFFLSIVNMMNISIYWIDDRRKEISIRKAFGISNLNIASMLFNEIFLLCFLSSILGILFQGILNLFLVSLSSYTLSITIENILSGISISFISAVFTVIIPIYKTLSVHPIELLKY